MNISQMADIERGLLLLLHQHLGANPLVVLVHANEWEFCPVSDMPRREAHRARGGNESSGKGEVAALLRILAKRVGRQMAKEQALIKEKRHLEKKKKAHKIDREIRKATRATRWRGHFLQAGAPGLGKRA